MYAHTASVLSSVAATIGIARVALTVADPLDATGEASPLLRRVEADLDALLGSSGQDRSIWPLVLALRDEISAYLLAAESLEKTGVAPTVTVALLRRGISRAQERLDQLANRNADANPRSRQADCAPLVRSVPPRAR
jgi:hypothetical protein